MGWMSRSSATVVLVLVGSLAMGACGDASTPTSVGAGPSEAAAVEGGVAQSDPGYIVTGFLDSPGTFSSLTDMKAQSEVVGLFEVVGEREGEVTNDSVDVRSSQRILELRVIEGFKGVRTGDMVDLWDAVYRYDLGSDASTPAALAVTTESYDVRPGQQVVLGLNPDVTFPGQYGIQSPSAVFVVDRDGSGFVDIERTNRVADEIDRWTLDRALDELRA